MEAVIDGRNGEASTSTYSGNLQVFPWKLPQTSMEGKSTSTSFHGNFQSKFGSNILPPTSVEASMKASMDVNGLQWKLVEKISMKADQTDVGAPLWKYCEKQLELRDTRRSRWKYVGVCGSLWKLPWGIFVEAALPLPPTAENFYVFPWKVPLGSFHGSKSTSTDFHGNFRGNFMETCMETSMEVNVLAWKLPLKLPGISVGIDRKSETMWQAPFISS